MLRITQFIHKANKEGIQLCIPEEEKNQHPVEWALVDGNSVLREQPAHVHTKQRKRYTKSSQP